MVYINHRYVIAHLEQHLRNLKENKKKEQHAFFMILEDMLYSFMCGKNKWIFLVRRGGDVSSMAYSFKTNRLISILNEILSPSCWIV